MERGRAEVASTEEITREMRDLSREALLPVLVLAHVLSWAWVGHVLSQGWAPWRHGAPAFLVMGGTVAAYLLRESGYRLAVWMLISGMLGAAVLIAALHPGGLAPAYGTLIIVVAHALLGSAASVAVVVLTWGGMVAAPSFVPGLSSLDADMLGVLLLYTLVWVLVWIAARPQETAVSSALAGWARARQALGEVRDRRAELYRVVRALEEATYRIERMNNELMLARAEAETARALKSKFAAMVSHELRGPLNLIVGFGELMALAPERYGTDLTPAYYADVDAIYRNTQHLQALVDDVLDLSQIEAERLPLVKDRIDLAGDVVRKALDTVRPLAERKGLRVRAALVDALPWVLADPVRVRQVLVNLLHNAIRYTERGEIVVRGAMEGQYVRISVCDTGAGVPESEIPRLFREFEQVDPSKRGATGSGLGLAISKQLVELHGGQIWMESVVGQGTTVHFTLPLPGSVPRRDPGRDEAYVAPSPGLPYCLVVHDAPLAAKLLDRHVPGYRMVGVPRAEEARAVVEDLHPQAIITTPGLSSAVARDLAPLGVDVPIISCRLPRDAGDQGGNGVLGYLSKPVSRQALHAMMTRVQRDGDLAVLLVDDDPDVVRLMESLLTLLPHPYRIVKAYDGEQALELMEETVPDIVFLDLLMPGLGGEETLERMRADERTRDVPVVIVSAKDWGVGQATLRTPLCVRRKRPLDPVVGGKCLQGLLDALNADYLPPPGVRAPSLRAARG